MLLSSLCYGFCPGLLIKIPESLTLLGLRIGAFWPTQCLRSYVQGHKKRSYRRPTVAKLSDRNSLGILSGVWVEQQEGERGRGRTVLAGLGGGDQESRGLSAFVLPVPADQQHQQQLDVRNVCSHPHQTTNPDRHQVDDIPASSYPPVLLAGVISTLHTFKGYFRSLSNFILSVSSIITTISPTMATSSYFLSIFTAACGTLLFGYHMVGFALGPGPIIC